MPNNIIITHRKGMSTLMNKLIYKNIMNQYADLFN